MLKVRYKQNIILVITFISVMLLCTSSVLALEPHENPETATQVFNGISLLRHYSNSLDSVLQKDITGIETKLVKMPFSNIPDTLDESSEEFTVSSINICHLVVEIDESVMNFQSLLGEFRLDEATEFATDIISTLKEANDELEYIEKAVRITGEELDVISAPTSSLLNISYSDLLDRIDRIKSMLILYEDLLKSAGLQFEDLSELTQITTDDLLETTGNILAASTEITLNIQHLVAYVGDNIDYNGKLTSKGKPLAGREINILVNGSRHLIDTTDSSGYFQGKLQVPYLYTSEIKLQALYYPQGKDTGNYLASLSSIVSLSVLYYEADLEITVDEKAYPGIPTTINGKFSYNQSISHEKRTVEIYLDNTLLSEFIAPEEFNSKIDISVNTTTGKHIVTVSAISSGRYSPVVTSTILNVTRASPILNIGLPGVMLIPGNIDLNGKLYSEIGPLEDAMVNMKLGNSHIEIASSSDGSFDAQLGMVMNFGLIGSQELEVQVFPQEPWNAPLFTTRKLLTINLLNCGGILIIVLFLSIYLGPRIQKRIGVYIIKRSLPTESVLQPETEALYSRSVLNPAGVEGVDDIYDEPKSKILYWYRFIVRMIQGIAEIIVKPQQTLREFASESGKILGPAARYFSEITGIVERLLYSRYQPTEDDAKQSEHMSNTIKYFTELNRIETGLHYSQYGENKDYTSNAQSPSRDIEKDIKHENN